MHLTLIPGPNRKKREKDEIKRVDLTDSRPKLKEARKGRIEECCCLNRKSPFSFLILFSSLDFLAIQYGCNSVGFIFCIFIAFVQMLVIGMYGKIKPTSRSP